VHIDPLAPGAIAPVEVNGDEFVVWRGRSGRLGSAPRLCPHLDSDLAEGYLAGDELVCAGHGWAFDGRGNVYKRNQFGRVDPKGTVVALTLTEDSGSVEVASAAHDGDVPA